MYAGSFSGSIEFATLPISSVAGTIRAELVLSSSKDKLAIHNGTIRGVDQSEKPLTAQLTGTVDCDTGALEAGRFENGSYQVNEFTSAATFTGTADANYTVDPPSATGTWEATSKETVGLIGGKGSWSLTLQAAL